MKDAGEFHKNYRQCKSCVNEKERKKYDECKTDGRICTICEKMTPTSFIKRKDKVCNDCHYKRSHPDGLRVCNTCSETKHMSLFVKHRTICQECKRTSDAERYKKSQESEQQKYNERKNSERVCAVCQETIPTSFIKRKDKVCNDCHYKKTHPDGLKVCNTCSETKHIDVFCKQRNICLDCRKAKDMQRYDHFKNEEGTRVCTVCKEEKECKKFSPGKKYCMVCLNEQERKDRNSNPVLKVKKNVRNRIYAVLSDEDKRQKSVDYLGCTTDEYLKWLTYSNPEYFFYGNVWHIDHVVPLARFDLSKPEQQMVAFNWRNTAPLRREENMSKKAKIDKKQIASHYARLQEYHTQQNTQMPQEYVELFATHLDAGTP